MKIPECCLRFMSIEIDIKCNLRVFFTECSDKAIFCGNERIQEIKYVYSAVCSSVAKHVCVCGGPVVSLCWCAGSESLGTYAPCVQDPLITIYETSQVFLLASDLMVYSGYSGLLSF